MTKPYDNMPACPLNRCGTCAHGGEPRGIIQIVCCRNRKSDHLNHYVSEFHPDCGLWEREPFSNISDKSLKYIIEERERAGQSKEGQDSESEVKNCPKCGNELEIGHFIEDEETVDFWKCPMCDAEFPIEDADITPVKESK
jgi:hypothetical protein